MKNTVTTPTGRYSSRMAKKASKITRWAKFGVMRRVLCFVVFIALCAGGLYYGNISKKVEKQSAYDKYLVSHDINDLNPMVLSYDSMYDEFGGVHMGNKPYQSLMGGYYYEGKQLSLFPGNNAESTIMKADKEDHILTNFLADNINVRDNTIFFRDPTSRKVSAYDIKTQNTIQLDFEHVGQFVVCGKNYYYIDINSSELIMYDYTSDESTTLADGVSSFAIAGNSVLFLNKEHELHSLNCETREDDIIASNVLAFSYNGKLWIQNNGKVFCRRIDEKNLTEFILGVNCSRLLGVTDSWMFYESNNYIYIHALDGSSVMAVNDQIFVCATDNTMLVYNASEKKYKTYRIQASGDLVDTNQLDNSETIQQLDGNDLDSEPVSNDHPVLIEQIDNAFVSQINIPKKLVFKSTGQTVYDSIAEENNIQNIIMESDGSLTVVANEDIPFSCETVSATLRSYINTEMGQNKLPHFVSVTAEDSLTDFKIVLNSVSMNLYEQKAISYVFFLSALYATIEDNGTESINIDLMNMKGDLINHMSTNG